MAPALGATGVEDAQKELSQALGQDAEQVFSMDMLSRPKVRPPEPPSLLMLSEHPQSIPRPAHMPTCCAADNAERARLRSPLHQEYDENKAARWRLGRGGQAAQHRAAGWPGQRHAQGIPCRHYEQQGEAHSAWWGGGE